MTGTQQRAAALASLEPRAVAALLADGGAVATGTTTTTASAAPAATEGDRLRAQLAARHRDFLAAAALVGRLEGEAGALAGRMATMRQQVAAFTDLPRVRREAAARHDAVIARLRELAQRHDTVQEALRAAEDELAAVRARLADDPHAAALAEADAALAAANAEVAALRADIDATTRDADFSAARTAALAAVGEVNVLLQRQLAAAVGERSGGEMAM